MSCVILKNTVIPPMNGFISAAFLRCGEEIWQMTVTFSGMQERNSMERLQNWQKPASGCMGSGDVAYQLELFSFLPVILRFWESDDEFPASLQVLVDRNILEYMHYETVMFAIGHLLERVEEEMERK